MLNGENMDELTALKQKVAHLEAENEELKRLEGITKDLYVQGVFEEAKQKIFDYFSPIARAVSVFTSVAVVLVTVIGVKEYISLNQIRSKMEEDARNQLTVSIDEVKEKARREIDEIINLELEDKIESSATRKLLRQEIDNKIIDIRTAYDNNFVIHRKQIDGIDNVLKAEIDKIIAQQVEIEKIMAQQVVLEDKIQQLETTTLASND